jgi:hypothetical protein
MGRLDGCGIRVEFYVRDQNRRECRFCVVVADFGEDWVWEVERGGINAGHDGG